ncbi:hypothetical protein KI387_008138, partial [Taxus chinensis]
GQGEAISSWRLAPSEVPVEIWPGQMMGGEMLARCHTGAEEEEETSDIVIEDIQQGN